jgi:hypothetical protein
MWRPCWGPPQSAASRASPPWAPAAERLPLDCRLLEGLAKPSRPGCTTKASPSAMSALGPAFTSVTLKSRVGLTMCVIPSVWPGANARHSPKPSRVNHPDVRPCRANPVDVNRFDDVSRTDRDVVPRNDHNEKVSRVRCEGNCRQAKCSRSCRSTPHRTLPAPASPVLSPGSSSARRTSPHTICTLYVPGVSTTNRREGKMALYWLTERSQALLELVGVEQRSFAAEIGAAPPLGERGSVASEVLTSGIPKAPLTAPGHIPALNLTGRQSADWRRQQSHSRGGRRTTRARQRQRHDSPSARRAAFRHAPKRPKTALLKPKPLGTHFGTLCRNARDAGAGSGRRPTPKNPAFLYASALRPDSRGRRAGQATRSRNLGTPCPDDRWVRSVGTLEKADRSDLGSLLVDRALLLIGSRTRWCGSL